MNANYDFFLPAPTPTASTPQSLGAEVNPISYPSPADNDEKTKMSAFTSAAATK